jgi:hypothetical protein
MENVQPEKTVLKTGAGGKCTYLHKRKRNANYNLAGAFAGKV